MYASNAVSIVDTTLRHTLVLLDQCSSCLVQEWQPNRGVSVVQGCSHMQTVFLTPLMFGVAHVHHLIEMVKFQGVKLTSAATMVSLCTLLCNCPKPDHVWRHPASRARG